MASCEATSSMSQGMSTSEVFHILHFFLRAAICPELLELLVLEIWLWLQKGSEHIISMDLTL